MVRSIYVGKDSYKGIPGNKTTMDKCPEVRECEISTGDRKKFIQFQVQTYIKSNR